jgi:hypothetical protein
MPFTPLDPLVSVKAANAGRLLDRFDRVRVHDSSTRVGILAHASAFGLVECSPEERPETRATELPEVVLHRLPRWQITREVPPRTACAHEVEQGIKATAKRVAAESPLRRSGRQEALEALPLDIGKVAGKVRFHAV